MTYESRASQLSRAEMAEVLLAHDELRRSHETLEREHEKLKQSHATQAQQIAWFKRQLFGPKSDRWVKPSDAQVFLGEALAGSPSSPPPSPDSPEIEVPAHRRRRVARPRSPEEALRFDPRVPVVTVHVPNPEVPEAERDQWVVVGEKVTDRLAQRPGSYVVIREVREVLKRKRDETFSCPPASSSVLEGSSVDVSLLAGLMIDKLRYHLPLYRQHQRLEAAGVRIGRSSLTRYFQDGADLLTPIYEAQVRSVLESVVLAMDEIPVKAGRKKTKPGGRGQMKTGYYWPIYGDRDEVVFPFADTRSHSVVSETLKEYCGTLLTDAYEAYDRYAATRAKVELAKCWAHTRRVFVEAQESEPALVAEVLTRIERLYEHEAEVRGQTPEAIREKRQTESAPIVAAFFDSLRQALEERVLLPSSPFTKAARYALDREKALRVFLAKPEVAIDTNHLERALRPIALGRKNWMFCTTESGARELGIVQSLLVTCQLHGIDPYTYLVDVFQRVQTHPAKLVRELTPRLWKARFAETPMRSVIDLVPASV
jgi:transposase